MADDNFDEALEEFKSSMKWKSMTDGYTRSLVLANLNGFIGYLRYKSSLKTPIECCGRVNMDLNEWSKMVRQKNEKWWVDIVTGKPITRNRGEQIALMHSELSEALEGERKGLMDDHLPHRRMSEVELADLAIRLFDYCGGHGYDLEGAVREKLAYNEVRADHKTENRLKDGGKKF
jgi:hypothetical protein